MAEQKPEKVDKAPPIARPHATSKTSPAPDVGPSTVGTQDASPNPPADPQTGVQSPQHWAEIPLPEDDSDSALGDDAESSTASVTSSILRYRTLLGRTYHHENGQSQYWAPNDDRQNNTLDIGHHSYTLLTGGKLYLAPLPEKIDKALDIGTGTGIWAMDFGDERPETEVIGTDISPIQPNWVPPNVSFQIEDFSTEWTFAENSIDFVRMRWLVGSVDDWIALYKNAYRVLKPGGYIETMEFDTDLLSDDNTVTEKTAAYQWGSIFQEGGRKAGSHRSFNPVSEGLVRKALEEARFEHITEKHYKLPVSEWSDDPVLHEIGQFTRMGLTNDIEGFIGMLATLLGWSKEDISVYAAHLRRELKGLKVHAYIRACISYAQKPLDT